MTVIYVCSIAVIYVQQKTRMAGGGGGGGGGAILLSLLAPERPPLLTWINFNPSMDK